MFALVYGLYVPVLTGNGPDVRSLYQSSAPPISAGLLAGLLDGDGHICGRGLNAVEMTVASVVPADLVAILLGLRCGQVSPDVWVSSVSVDCLALLRMVIPHLQMRDREAVELVQMDFNDAAQVSRLAYLLQQLPASCNR
jgi:hypothetical protein